MVQTPISSCSLTLLSAGIGNSLCHYIPKGSYSSETLTYASHISQSIPYAGGLGWRKKFPALQTPSAGDVTYVKHSVHLEKSGSPGITHVAFSGRHRCWSTVYTCSYQFGREKRDRIDLSRVDLSPGIVPQENRPSSTSKNRVLCPFFGH